MKCRLVGMFLVAIILSVAFAVWLIIPGGSTTKANCDRIQTGKTEREVEEILGRPATETLQWPGWGGVAWVILRSFRGNRASWTTRKPTMSLFFRRPLLPHHSPDSCRCAGRRSERGRRG
jgi:hypothetical protein